MVMWRVGEDDTKGRARPLPTYTYNMHMCLKHILQNHDKTLTNLS